MTGCLTPLTLYRKERGIKNNHTDVVPCGRCPNCLKRRINQWAFRLEKEQQISKSASFLTLTYDEEALPYSEGGYPTLVPKDHQLFMKKLRKHLHDNRFKYNITPNTKLKYYAVGEYGDTNYRPHYHSILFNLPQKLIDDESIVENIWGKGKIQVAVCNPASIKYVAGYVNKRIHPKKQDELDDRLIEFSHMSKGLGKNFITPETTKFYKRKLQPYLTVENGQKISMPRYYRDKMYNKSEQNKLAEKAKIHHEENEPFFSGKHEFEYVKNEINQFNKKQNHKSRKI